MVENGRNELGQPIGFAVPDWQARPRPPKTAMEGNWARVEPLDPDAHGKDLFAAFRADRGGRIWTYMPYGPFDEFEAYDAWLRTSCMDDDPFFHAIVDRQTGAALGVASFLRINPKVGVIEVGHICMSPALQRTPIATDALFLMMTRVFDELGYRRYEWKCDALNAGSRSAAARLGFSFEGVFRQATLYKGRNRDTAWFAIVDRQWSALRTAYEQWLDASNFDANGMQKTRLSELTSAALSQAR